MRDTLYDLVASAPDIPLWGQLLLIVVCTAGLILVLNR